MIELNWLFESDSRMNAVIVTEFMLWMMNAICDMNNEKIILNGTIYVKDGENPLKHSILLLCDAKGQNDLLHLVQQPPGEFKGKYVASILSEEPIPVNEQKEEDDAGELCPVAIT